MNLNNRVIKISKVIFFLIILGCVLISMQYAFHKVQHEFNNGGTFDWPFFVEASHNFMNSGKVYDDKLNKFYPGAPIYKFPPFFVSVLVFLAEHGISEESMRHGFSVLQIAIYLGCALILGWLSTKENKLLSAAFIIIFVSTYESFVVNFYRLQPEILVLLFLVASSYLVVKQKDIMAGACIGFLAVLKVYPAFFATYFLFEKKISYFIGLAIGISVSLLFSLMVIGYAEHHRYFIEILPVLLKEEVCRDAENVSIGALLIHYSLSQKVAIFWSNCVLLTGIVIVFLGYLKASVNVWRQRDTVLLAFSVLISAFVLGTKNAWWHYQILLMFPIIVGMGLSLSKKHNDPVSVVMILIACLCINFNNAARLAPLINVAYGVLIPGVMATLLTTFASIRLYLRATNVFGQKIANTGS